MQSYGKHGRYTQDPNSPNFSDSPDNRRARNINAALRTSDVKTSGNDFANQGSVDDSSRLFNLGKNASGRVQQIDEEEE